MSGRKGYSLVDSSDLHHHVDILNGLIFRETYFELDAMLTSITEPISRAELAC